MDNNEKKRQNDNNQPKMPKFNMNWIYTVILISLGILFITGGGDALAVGSSAKQEATYTKFKEYVEKGYAKSVVVNKDRNMLTMYVNAKNIRDVFGKSAKQVGPEPAVNVEFGSVDELEKYLTEMQKAGKIADFSYENEKGNSFMNLLINLSPFILGIALSMAPFVSTEQAIFLAPFVSTFIHDAFSALWATLYNGVRGNLKNVYKAAFKTKSGKFVMLAAVIGGPIGMTGYVLAINYMGASIGAVASAVFPAIGAILAYFFLKEKMQWYRWIFLLATLLGVYGLSYSPELNITDFWLGIAGAMMCAFGWGIEAVILAKCMQDPDVKDEYALQIRQTTSALVYGIVLLPLLHGWGFTVSLFTSGTGWLLPVIAIAAFFATLSYLCYYRAIAAIGASKSMALNVTYAAWAIFFTAVFLGDTSVLTPTTIICALIVIVCGILTAADGKDLFSKSKA